MKCTLVGVKRVDYVSKKTGKQVLGWNLFITRSDEHVEGLVAEDVYCADAMSSQVNAIKPYIGEEIQLLFNRFGGVDEVNVIS